MNFVSCWSSWWTTTMSVDLITVSIHWISSNGYKQLYLSLHMFVALCHFIIIKEFNLKHAWLIVNIYICPLLHGGVLPVNTKVQLFKLINCRIWDWDRIIIPGFLGLWLFSAFSFLSFPLFWFLLFQLISIKKN